MIGLLWETSLLDADEVHFPVRPHIFVAKCHYELLLAYFLHNYFVFNQFILS